MQWVNHAGISGNPAITSLRPEYFGATAEYHGPQWNFGDFLRVLCRYSMESWWAAGLLGSASFNHLNGIAPHVAASVRVHPRLKYAEYLQFCFPG